MKLHSCALRHICLKTCAIVISGGAILSASTLSVGPSGKYRTPCAALKFAAAGDIIQVDAAGAYNGDVCRWTTNSLTIRGINGRPHIDAAGLSSEGKAIWVIQGNNTEIDNIEFSGTKVSSGNGAGIRLEGQNLTVRNSYFHDNQEGILTASTGIGNILIEYTEFAYNGAGDGQSHNLYINHADSFTMQYCYSHHANVGHLLKSRALINYVLYNRFSDETTGTASYELDLPSGGTSYIIGNFIEQGLNSQNPTLFSYLEESQNLNNPPNPAQDLYVVNNTFVNDGAPGTFVNIDRSVTVPALIQNNIFRGAGTATNQPNAIMPTNLIGINPKFIDSVNYSYGLSAGSPAIDTGSVPGSANGFSLVPVLQYVHSACQSARVGDGLLDIGASEAGMAQAVQCASYTSQPPLTSSLSVSSSQVVAGTPASVTATIAGNAPLIGTPVTLISSNALISPLSTATIPAGQTSITIPIQTNWVASPMTATISAYVTGSVASVSVTVTPAPTNLVGLQQLTFAAINFAVNLSGPAPAGGAVIAIASADSTIIQAPATVTIPAGALSSVFSVLTEPVTGPSFTTLSASFNGITFSLPITVIPPSLSWLGLKNFFISGGGSTMLLPYLAGPAPIGGLTVSLQSSLPDIVPVPASVVVPAGSTIVYVPITAAAVASSTTVVFTATYLGINRSVTLTITP